MSYQKNKLNYKPTNIQQSLTKSLYPRVLVNSARTPSEESINSKISTVLSSSATPFSFQELASKSGIFDYIYTDTIEVGNGVFSQMTLAEFYFENNIFRLKDGTIYDHIRMTNNLILEPYQFTNSYMNVKYSEINITSVAETNLQSPNINMDGTITITGNVFNLQSQDVKMTDNLILINDPAFPQYTNMGSVGFIAGNPNFISGSIPYNTSDQYIGLVFQKSDSRFSVVFTNTVDTVTVTPVTINNNVDFQLRDLYVNGSNIIFTDFTQPPIQITTSTNQNFNYVNSLFLTKYTTSPYIVNSSIRLDGNKILFSDNTNVYPGTPNFVQHLNNTTLLIGNNVQIDQNLLIQDKYEIGVSGNNTYFLNLDPVGNTLFQYFGSNESFRIDTSGHVLLASTKRLGINGTTLTKYIYENGGNFEIVSDSNLYLNPTNDVIIDTGKRLYFDGLTNTSYIAANALLEFTSSTLNFQFNPLTHGIFNTSKQLQFGSGTQYIQSTDNTSLDICAATVIRLCVDVEFTGDLYVLSGSRIGINGSGLTKYIYENAGNFEIVSNTNIHLNTTNDVFINSGSQFGIDGAALTNYMYLNGLNYEIVGLTKIALNAPIVCFLGASIDLTNGAKTIDLINANTSALNIESGLVNIDTANTRVGINTVLPGTTLDINGNSIIGSTFSGNTAPTNSLSVEDKVLIGTFTTNAGKLIIDGGGIPPPLMNFINGSYVDTTTPFSKMYCIAGEDVGGLVSILTEAFQANSAWHIYARIVGANATNAGSYIIKGLGVTDGSTFVTLNTTVETISETNAAWNVAVTGVGLTLSFACTCDVVNTKYMLELHVLGIEI